MGESYFECASQGASRTVKGFDVVFLHGITGHYKKTWTNIDEEFWPSWLIEEFPNINVYAAGYDSAFLADLMTGAGASIRDQASVLLDSVASRQDPSRPVIFVTHSLGGLIVKQMLRLADAATNKKKKAVASLVKGVAFLATPHLGADIAKSVTSVAQLVASQPLKDLVKGAEPLVDLAQWFSGWAVDRGIPVAAYYETEKTKGVLVVDKISANPNVHGCDPTAVSADHITITKISGKDHNVYKSLCSFLKDIVTSSDVGGSSGGGLDDDVLDDFKAFTTPVETDRQTLAEKLSSAGRSEEIKRAERLKERFNIALRRNIAQPSAVRKYTRIMSNIETRFNRHVLPAVLSHKSNSEIDMLVQDAVLDPTVKAHELVGDEITASLIESALYYLAGNCHLRWDDV